MREKSFLNVVVARQARAKMWTKKKVRQLFVDLDLFYIQGKKAKARNVDGVRSDMRYYGQGKNSLFIEHYTSGIIKRIYCNKGTSPLTLRLAKKGYKTMPLYTETPSDKQKFVEILAKETTLENGQEETKGKSL